MPAVLKTSLQEEQKRVLQSRPGVDSSSPDTSEYESKIQGLLDVNRVMARENQYLLAQCEILRKEHDALGHMMRSRMALSNVKELEYKSVIEGMKAVVKEKEDRERALVGNLEALQEKYAQLLDIMKSYEGSHREDDTHKNTRNIFMEEKENIGEVREREGRHQAVLHERLGASLDASHVSLRKPGRAICSRRISQSDDEKDLGERGGGETRNIGHQQWPTPVLLRLDALQKNSGRREPLLEKRISPSSKDTAAHEDITSFVSSEGDAFSTNGFQTPKHAVVHSAPLNTKEAPVQELFYEEARTTGRKKASESRRKSDGNTKRLDQEACYTEPKSVRSSLRRRKPINYALPSVRSKLRQGDPHTFGIDSISSTPGPSGRCRAA
ncbi:hypothetical protein M9435_001232 [Picochlorum sp. BPE23]|nr:hypothetical protein M9435_001232 [Picochlorum sp. BPE23]